MTRPQPDLASLLLLSAALPIWFTRMELCHFSTNGFALIPQVLDNAECEAVGTKVAIAADGSAGTRGLLSHACCRLLSARIRQHPSLASLLPASFVAVQCMYFEKSLSRNWLVPVHQDLSIPIAERVEHPSLRGWSEKEGSLYVQAPIELLGQLVAVRLHIDDCGTNDGPLRVVPGSHLRGQIQAEAAMTARHAETEVVCTAERGSALVMRPLLLHSSSKAKGRSLRRVLHYLFGPRTLPFGLRWQLAVD